MIEKREQHKNVWMQADEYGTIFYDSFILLCGIIAKDSDVRLEEYKEGYRALTTLLNYKDWAHHHTGIIKFLFEDGNLLNLLLPCCVSLH